MSESVHLPVMAAEVTRLLLESGGNTFIDCTAGGGGHIAALLEGSVRPVRILGLDLDPESIQRCKDRFRGRPEVSIVRGDYSSLAEVVRQEGWVEVSGILADFGQSSDQMDTASRGMSHRYEGALDMRYDPTRGESAADLLNRITLNDLISILRNYGEERHASRVAREILRRRPIRTTSDLAEAVRSAVGDNFIQKSLARCFMALRVAVNDELNAIESFLPQALAALEPGGRLICLSYDSQQDRRVKEFLHSRANPCTCPPNLPVCLCGRKSELTILTRHPERPSEGEVAVNPRSRSARLRAAEKLPERLV